MTNQNKIILGIAVVVVVGVLLLGRTPKEVVAQMWEDTDIECLVNGHQFLAQHIHPTLSITVDGKPEPVPMNLGLTGNCMAEVHTHDEAGVIHIESVGPKTFTLSDFFSVWAQDLNREGYTLTVTSDGAVVENPATLEMRDGQKIALNYKSL